MPYKDDSKNKECKTIYAKSIAGKQKQKEYYIKNREQILLKDKAAKQKKFNSLSEEEKDFFLKKRKESCLKSYYKHRDKIIEKNKNRKFGYELKWRYGISYDEYLEILEKQNKQCAICGCAEFEKRWTSKKLPFAVDHCHDSKKIRGLLCDNCNVMLGHAQNNIEILQNAIIYLENDRKETSSGSF